jgi:hypothetical protein
MQSKPARLKSAPVEPMRTEMSKLKTGLAIIVATAGLMASLGASAEGVTAWRSPSCGCCHEWAKHVEQSGLSVEMIDAPDIDKIKREHGISSELASCHTAVAGGYMIEGHVPPREIKRLLAERPDAIGLAVPGMPNGAPGMDSGSKEPFNVLLVKKDGSTEVFAKYP